MNSEGQRLMQALQFFKERSHGAELPKGVMEALDGLSEALGQEPGLYDSPGQREAAKSAPGTKGTGEPFPNAARGVDGTSPGQRAAAGKSGGFEITVQPTSVA